MIFDNKVFITAIINYYIYSINTVSLSDSF